MNDLKPNSHRFKEEQAEEREKKAQKVIKGTAKTRKKSELAKLGDVFISEDVSSVKSYVLMDILVPAIKKAISDIVTNGIDMILYGESGRREKRSGSSNYVSYRDYSKRDRDEGRRSDDRRNSLGYDNIILDSRGEAEMVLEQMVDMIDQYDEVSVADLYDMVDLTAPYTANKYGWTNLRDASVVRTRDGYAFKLPRAKPL